MQLLPDCFTCHKITFPRLFSAVANLLSVYFIIFIVAETWKIPIRTELYKGIGLVAGSLFLLTVTPAVHAVTKQKLFTTLLQIIALGLALSGGNYFCLFV